MEKNYPIDATLSDVVNKKCPILCAMDVIGSKWKLPIVWYLHEKENTRFNKLKRRIPGITHFMLTKSSSKKFLGYQSNIFFNAKTS